MSRISSALVVAASLLLAAGVARAQTVKEILERVDQVGHTKTARMKK